jgi:hypothetical protein
MLQSATECYGFVSADGRRAISTNGSNPVAGNGGFDDFHA